MNKICHISHIVLSGGAVKGMCYLGIFRYLYLENMVESIKNVSGSSIGAYFGLLLTLKIPIDVIESEISDFLIEINDNHIMDITKSKFTKIFNDLGFNSLKICLNPIVKFLKERYGIDDITFIDLVKKTGINFYVSTTNINTGCNKIFSAENTPNISVLTAVIASMSIPFLFEPVVIEGEYYVDGVLSCDLPIDIFDKVNKNYILAIILYPTKQEQIKYLDKDSKYNFMDYTLRISQVMISSLFRQYSNKYKNKNKPYILKIQDIPYETAIKYKVEDNDVKFDLTQSDVDNLILKGFIDMSQYMNNRYKDSVIDYV